MTTPSETPEPGDGPSRALMIYDGDCGFCTYWARRWRHKLEPALDIAPLQDRRRVPSDLPARRLEEAVHLVDPDGRVFTGAAAVFKALALDRRYAPLWWLYRKLPGFRPVSERVYRWVADHRGLVSRWTRWMRRRTPPSGP